MTHFDFERALHDDSVGLIVDERTSGETLVVAFGGISSHMGGLAPFEFLRVLAAQDARVVFVRDLDQCWYQRGVRGVSTDLDGTTRALRELVGAMQPQKIVTVGTSAGGFAAIYFACRLQADLAVAFGPQTFTCQRLRWWYRDRRWVREIRAIGTLDQEHVCRDLRPVVRDASRARRHPKIEIHYGADVRVDRAHARRLAPFADVVVRAHPGGHNITKQLRDRGELDTIVATAIGL